MKHILFVFTMLTAAASGNSFALQPVSESADFTYDSVDSFYLFDEDEVVTFANFPGFEELKEIVIRSMNNDHPVAEQSESATYTLAAVSGQEYVLIDIVGAKLEGREHIG